MKLFELFGEITIDDSDANEKIKDTDENAKGLGDTMKKVGGGVATAGKVIGTGMLAVGAGVAAVTAKISENTDRIDKMSQNIGFSAEGFQEWEFILSQSGTSIDSLERGMATLSKQVTDGAEGSKIAVEAFEKLNINVEELAGLSQEEIFEKTISGLQEMEAGAERTALANQLLGGAAKEMGALMNTTTESIEGMREQAHDLGAVLSEDTVAAGVQMTDAIDQMKRSLIGTLTEAFAPMIPTVMELIKTFVDILPPILEFVKPLIEKLVPVITKIIDRLLPPFIRLLDALMPVLEPLIDIFLVLLDSALLPIIEALLPLIEVLLPPLATLLEALVPIIEGLANILSSVLGVAIDGIIWYFGELIEFMQPVLDLFTAIGDVAGKAFSGIGDFVGGVGDKVGGFFGSIELPSFDVGTDYVPEDMVAMIHKGERILTADENRAYRSGMGGTNITINASNIVGRNAGNELGKILVDAVHSKGAYA